MTRETTRYSRVEKGDAGNHQRHMQFDDTDGYIGISSTNDDGSDVQRVLLSPKQYRALVTFVKRHGVAK